jgi:hypothetical protein
MSRRTLVVTLSSPDKSKSVDLDAFGAWIAEEIGRREGEGWHLVSTSVVNLRQGGTAANVVFQSGGQYATHLGAVIVYQREA